MNLSIYLHFPFCKNRCSYCNFYKELYDQKLEKDFYQALMIETELAAEQLKNSFKDVSTIFIGGGTPSMGNIDLLAKWVEHLKKYFHIQNGIEFSLESNPETITYDRLKELKDIGITRPTFGVQSFSKKMLKLMSRRHNPHESQQAIYYSNILGFKTFGVDQIFGIPSQTNRIFSSDIDQILELDPYHISLYQLTFEENTPLGDKYFNGEIEPFDTDLLSAMYRSAVAKFKEHGYTHYEISSFAKDGHECRHNINYWNGTAYLGLGPSAHSFYNDVRFFNHSSIDEYIKSLNKGSLPRTVDESGKEERMIEAVYLSLRTIWGVDRKRFEKRFGQKAEDILKDDQLDLMEESEYLIRDDKSIKLTESGFFMADDIIERILK